jgi:hypothetical protein
LDASLPETGVAYNLLLFIQLRADWRLIQMP